ncbi:protein diaphanous [Anaeramoeba flamelloides]|uniref:Protein diaphanous n=1 Tax=Anaeramoeba flamelloides TaxID=1746091 RepID=A0ABQ8X4V0_9EUKA|nr:protein diaphanous [Anaeramoeba flamelloides]
MSRFKRSPPKKKKHRKLKSSPSNIELRSTSALVITNLPPMPQIEELNNIFEEFVYNELNLPMEKAQGMLKFPAQTKWMMICQRNTKGEEEDNSKKPQDYLTNLTHKPTSGEVTELRVNLTSKPMSWVIEFVEIEGHEVLLNLLEQTQKGDFTSNEDWKMLTELIRALKALMNNSKGLKAVLNHEGGVYTITCALAQPSTSIRGIVMELLAAVSFIPPRGYQLVFGSLTKFAKEFGETRFFTILTPFKEPNPDWGNLTKSMNLINALVLDDSLEGRVGIRNEFLDLGLKELLNQFRSDIEPDFDKQVTIFYKLLKEDQESMIESYGTDYYNLGSPIKILPQLITKLEERGIKELPEEFLRNLVLVIFGTHYRQEKIWQVLDDLLQSAIDNPDPYDEFSNLLIYGERKIQSEKLINNIIINQVKSNWSLEKEEILRKILNKEIDQNNIFTILQKDFENQKQKVGEEIEELNQEFKMSTIRYRWLFYEVQKKIFEHKKPLKRKRNPKKGKNKKNGKGKKRGNGKAKGKGKKKQKKENSNDYESSNSEDELRIKKTNNNNKKKKRKNVLKLGTIKKNKEEKKLIFGKEEYFSELNNTIVNEMAEKIKKSVKDQVHQSIETKKSTVEGYGQQKKNYQVKITNLENSISQLKLDLEYLKSHSREDILVIITEEELQKKDKIFARMQKLSENGKSRSKVSIFDQKQNTTSSTEKEKSDLSTEKNTNQSISIPPPPNMGGGGGGGIPPPPMGGGGSIPPPPMGGGGGIPPPPMGGGGGVPPPPMGGGGGLPPPPMFGKKSGGIMKTKKPNPKPKVPMKAFHWTKISDLQVEKTIWKDLVDDKIKIDEDEFIDFFKQPPKKVISKDTSNSKSQKKQLISFCDPKTVSNFGIVIQTFKMSFDEIRNAILSVDGKRLSQQQVRSLQQYLPTQEEKNSLKEYKGDLNQLQQVDRLFLKIIDIPRLNERIKGFLIKFSFMEQLTDLEPNIKIIETAMKQLKESESFKKLLEIILAFGNIMNGGSRRGGAYGFRTDLLNKLVNSKSSADIKVNLLHYIAEHVEKKNPEILDFKKDLFSCKKASNIPLSELSSGIGQLRLSINFLDRELENHSEPFCEEDLFKPEIGKFFKSAKQKFDDIESRFNSIENNFKDLLKLYGETDMSLKPKDFFLRFANFIDSFSLAQKQNKKRKEDEIKKKKREQQQKNRSKSIKSNFTPLKGSGNKGVMDDIIDAMRTGEAFTLRKSKMSSIKKKGNPQSFNFKNQLRKSNRFDNNQMNGGRVVQQLDFRDVLKKN